MLPVSSWPPGPPGSSLSPFGKPRRIRLCDHNFGYVIPTGAWVVATGSNRVVMFRPPVVHDNPARSPGTGILPGQFRPRSPPFDPCPPTPPRNNVWTGPGQINFTNGTAAIQMSLSQPAAAPCPPTPCPPPVVRPPFQKFNDEVEAWRAWQRRTGRTNPPQRPLPGRRPPNWYGWNFIDAPCSILVQPGSGGLVIADGQNVVISGEGTATLTQAYSV